jgi:hypothetical protein
VGRDEEGEKKTAGEVKNINVGVFRNVKKTEIFVVSSWRLQ